MKPEKIGNSLFTHVMTTYYRRLFYIFYQQCSEFQPKFLHSICFVNFSSYKTSNEIKHLHVYNFATSSTSSNIFVRIVNLGYPFR